MRRSWSRRCGRARSRRCRPTRTPRRCAGRARRSRSRIPTPSAHALLADCLHALREDDEAVTEYEKALTSRPDDPTFTHSLSVARHALASESSSPGASSKREHGSHGRHSTATAAPVEGVAARATRGVAAAVRAAGRGRPIASDRPPNPDDHDDKPRDDKPRDDKPRDDKPRDDKPRDDGPAAR